MNLGPYDCELEPPDSSAPLPALPPPSTWSGAILGTHQQCQFCTWHALSLNPVWPPSPAEPQDTCHLLLREPKRQLGPAIPSPRLQPLRGTALICFIPCFVPSIQIRKGTVPASAWYLLTHPDGQRMLVPTWVWPNSGKPWTGLGRGERPTDTHWGGRVRAQGFGESPLFLSPGPGPGPHRADRKGGQVGKCLWDVQSSD